MALIQASAVSNSSGAADNVITLTSVVPGSLLIAEVSWAQQTNSNPPTAAGWTAVQNPPGQIFLGVGWVGSCLFAKIATSTSETITLVRGASGTLTAMSAVVAEFVNGLSAVQVDVSTNAAFATGTSGNSGTTSTTTVAGTLIIGALGIVDAATGTNAAFGISDPATTGYTSLGVHNNNTASGTGFQSSYKFVTATGTQIASWTWTPSSAGIGTIAAFKLAPRIDTQPVSQSVFSGQTATFTIAATTSGGTLHYQWKFDGANVGSDSNSYARSLCVAADSGKTVSCDVTDDNGTTSSATVNLYVDVNKMFYLLA